MCVFTHPLGLQKDPVQRDNMLKGSCVQKVMEMGDGWLLLWAFVSVGLAVR